MGKNAHRNMSYPLLALLEWFCVAVRVLVKQAHMKGGSKSMIIAYLTMVKGCCFIKRVGLSFSCCKY